MLKEKKIAVFFDCENVSSKYIEGILNSLSTNGDVMIARAYCDWSNTNYKVWSDSLHKHGLEAIHVQPNTTHKNAADIKIVIDVMKTICTSKVDTIAIVSSDSDFTALAIEVKANNFDVIGFGEKKAPASLRNIYSVFNELSTRSTGDQNKEKALTEIKKIIHAYQDKDDYVNVAKIGICLNKRTNIGTPKNYDAKSWGSFIKKYPNEFITKSVGKKGSTLMVKCAA